MKFQQNIIKYSDTILKLLQNIIKHSDAIHVLYGVKWRFRHSTDYEFSLGSSNLKNFQSNN